MMDINVDLAQQLTNILMKGFLVVLLHGEANLLLKVKYAKLTTSQRIEQENIKKFDHVRT